VRDHRSHTSSAPAHWSPNAGLVWPPMFRSSWIIFSIVSPTVSFILRPSSSLICQPIRRLYVGYVGYYRSESSLFLRSNRNSIVRRNQHLREEAHQRKRTPGFGRQMTSDETDPTIEEDVAVPAKSTTRTRTRSSTAVDAASKGQATPPTADEKKAGPKKRKTSKDDKDTDTTESEKAPRKTKAPTHQVQTERDDIPKLWDTEKAAESGSYSKFACSSYLFHPLPLNSTTTASRITSLQDRVVECCWNQGDAQKFAERIP
jgi:hypothetical protein